MGVHVVAEAIILAVRWHGEHGAIVRALSAEAGVLAGYVRGGRSRRLRPVLIAGNVVRGEWRARVDAQLPALTVELVHSRAPLLAEPLAAAAIDWATALTCAALPEAEAAPRLHAGLSGLLDAIEAAPGARGWTAALVRYEMLILASLGFGLDLDACAATGATNDLGWVSPRTGQAVSRAAAAGHEHRLIALPAFLTAGGKADWGDLLDGLRLTGHFVRRDLFGDRPHPVLDARERLVDRLHAAAGLTPG